MQDPALEHPVRELTYIGLALLVALPGTWIALSGAEPPPVVAALVFGLAIVGAAFLLSWAAEVVQMDIAAGLALALLALIALLPEYAVDFVFTWKAGEDPSYAPYALANMTGANQLLIGFGWPLVVLLGTWRVRKLSKDRAEEIGGATATEVRLVRGQSIDIAFLTLASIYGLTLPLRSSLTLVDAAVLVTLYVLYLIRLSKAPTSEPHLIGPAAYLGSFPTRKRRTVNIVMFVVSAGVILACAEPFAESLLHVGEELGIDEFLLVKWLAPLASEAPELIVAGLFAWRLQARIGLGALVSSKVNQWTLLVGSLPIVYAISSASLHGLPLDVQQRDELFVTAAQSVFAVAVLASRSISRKEAWVLLGLFAVQLASSGILPEKYAAPGRLGVGIAFLVGAVWVLRNTFGSLRIVMRDGLRVPVAELYESQS
jgi:cation:H+ antiporter